MVRNNDVQMFKVNLIEISFLFGVAKQPFFNIFCILTFIRYVPTSDLYSIYQEYYNGNFTMSEATILECGSVMIVARWYDSSPLFVNLLLTRWCIVVGRLTAYPRLLEVTCKSSK